MSTLHPRSIQLPLRPRKILIADVNQATTLYCWRRPVSRKFRNIPDGRDQREQYTTGTPLLSERRTNVCLHTCGDDSEHKGLSSLHPNAKDCEAEGVQLPTNIMAQDPKTHVIMPQEYLTKVVTGQMPPLHNHDVMKEMFEKAITPGDKMKFVMLEFPNFQRPQRPDTPAPQSGINRQ